MADCLRKAPEMDVYTQAGPSLKTDVWRGTATGTMIFAGIEGLIASTGAETVGEHLLALLQIVGPLEAYVSMRDPSNKELKELKKLKGELVASIAEEPSGPLASEYRAGVKYRMAMQRGRSASVPSSHRSRRRTQSAHLGGGKQHYTPHVSRKVSHVKFAEPRRYEPRRLQGEYQRADAIRTAKKNALKCARSLAEDVAKEVSKSKIRLDTVGSVAEYLESKKGPKFTSVVPASIKRVSVGGAGSVSSFSRVIFILFMFLLLGPRGVGAEQSALATQSVANIEHAAVNAFVNAPYIPTELIKKDSIMTSLQAWGSSLVATEARTHGSMVARFEVEKRETNTAMKRNPVTEGVIPWIQSTSLESIFSYSQYKGVTSAGPLYKISKKNKMSADILPAGKVAEPISSRTAQAEVRNLLDKEGYYIGDVSVVMKGNYYASSSFAEAIGYSGIAQSHKDITDVYFQVIKTRDPAATQAKRAGITKANDERHSKMDAISTLRISSGRALSKLSRSINDGLLRSAVRSELEETINPTTVLDMVSNTASSISQTARAATTEFITGKINSLTNFFSGTTQEPVQVTLTPSAKDIVKGELILHEAELGDIVNKQVEIRNLEAEIKDLDDEIAVLEDNISKEATTHVITIHATAGEFQTGLVPLVIRYLRDYEGDVNSAVASKLNYEQLDILHAAFYRPERVARPVAPPSMLARLEQEGAWGRVKWGSHIEDVRASLSDYLGKAQKVNKDAVADAITSGTLSSDDGKAIILANTMGSQVLAQLDGAIQKQFQGTSNAMLVSIGQEIVKGIAHSEEDITAEQQEGYRNFVDGATIRAKKVADLVLEAADDVGETAGSAILSVGKLVKFVAAQKYILMGLLAIDFMGMSFADVTALSLGAAGTAAGAAAGAAAGVAAGMIGGPIGAAVGMGTGAAGGAGIGALVFAKQIFTSFGFTIIPSFALLQIMETFNPNRLLMGSLGTIILIIRFLFEMRRRAGLNRAPAAPAAPASPVRSRARARSRSRSRSRSPPRAPPPPAPPPPAPRTPSPRAPSPRAPSPRATVPNYRQMAPGFERMQARRAASVARQRAGGTRKNRR